MDRAEDYGSRRRRYWPEIEAFFGQLPPELYRPGVLLRHDLATAHSNSGQFDDLLSRDADDPLLDLHVWLLEDWAVPETDSRAQLDKHLFVSTVLLVGAAYVRESILSEDTNFDARYHALEQALTRRAVDHLGQLFPATSPFWDYYHAFINDEARPGAGPHLASAWLALAKIPVAGAVLYLGQPFALRLPHLMALLDSLTTTVQFQTDLANLRRDLGRGHHTYPVERAMHRAGLTTLQGVSPEQILGALALTGTISEMVSENITQLESAQTQADALGWPTFNAYLETVKDQLRELSQLFSLRGRANAARPSRPLFASAAHPPAVTLAIEMAEGYLLADRTWRESWEVQRRGMLGERELIGQAFAPGLVVEALCQHRADLSEQVEAALQSLAANDFRYYPHPAVPPDADDLGLALRLFPYCVQKDLYRQHLQRPLNWMAANIAESGQIACWFTQDVAGLAAGQTLRWGNTCATVEANLLLGLIAYDQKTYRPIIERSAAHWLERWISGGLGTNTLYAPHYALWVAVELLERLSALPGPVWRPDRISAALDRCRQHWQTYTEQVTAPQEAAFLTLISLRASKAGPLSDTFNPQWIQVMVKNQRYDGSWAGEPLFVTPTRGEVATWYSSHSVTTAYIWHALKTYRQWQASPA